MMLRVWSWAADREAAGALTEGSHEKQGKAGREAGVSGKGLTPPGKSSNPWLTLTV